MFRSNAQSFGLEMNVINTKAMYMGTEADPDAEIRIQHEEVQVVNTCRFCLPC